MNDDPAFFVSLDHGARVEEMSHLYLLFEQRYASTNHVIIIGVNFYVCFAFLCFVIDDEKGN